MSSTPAHLEALALASTSDKVSAMIYADALADAGRDREAASLRLALVSTTGSDRWDYNPVREVERYLGVPQGTIQNAAGGSVPPIFYSRNPDMVVRGALMLDWIECHSAAIEKTARVTRAKIRCAPSEQQKAAREQRRASRLAGEEARKGRTILERIEDAREAGSCITEMPTRRLRVRAVGINTAAADARSKATETKTWRAVCRDGGSVANTYGYPASTEAVLAISDPQGRVVVWFGRLPANKVTSGGAAARCLPVARPLFDERYGCKATQSAWKEIKAIHRLLAAGGCQWQG